MATSDHMNTMTEAEFMNERNFLNEFRGFLESFEQAEGSSVAQGAETYYLARLHDMAEVEETSLFVDFNHLLSYSRELAEMVLLRFYQFLPSMRSAVYQLMLREQPSFAEQQGLDRFSVGFANLPNLDKIRDLRSGRIGQLTAISGTVTRSSDARPELIAGSFTCMDCQTEANNVEQQFKFTEPTMCRNTECQNRTRWHLRTEDCKFVDWQKLRVQEDAGDIPPGSMPRTIDVILRGSIVESAKAGDKCVFVGTLVVVPEISQLVAPGDRTRAVANGGGQRRQGGVGEGVTGLKALGVRDLTYRTVFLANNIEPLNLVEGAVNIREESDELHMSEEEKAEIRQMFDAGGIYNRLARSICPHVFGHDDIKRGVLLMLMGGVHKEVSEGMHLRGDINICVVGDPSTAKSQFLKYVKDFLPRAVYTSGKASSAAGLTASVIKDGETGEFSIEAGALMLADNGICCIDEFDKMDVKDQVAIHEAMEQQTISISKAGVQATLNARTSVLAAANPVEGRYDKSRSLKANINMSAPIMSRFDLFFVIIDECDEVSDHNLATHIVSMHRDPDSTTTNVDFPLTQLQRYIRFARTIKPKISPEAAEVLVSCYTKLRQGDVVGAQQSSYRITVRQLESMVRLSEALARTHLSDTVQSAHVSEAYRLLQRSIIRIESQDIKLDEPDSFDALEPPPAADAVEEARSEHDSDGPKQPISISFERYQKISFSLVHHIRQVGGDGEDPTGVLQRDLVEWYLESLHLDEDSQLVEETRLIHNLIARLIHHDHVLISIEPEQLTGDGAEDAGNRTLLVNPNFNAEGY